MQTRILYLFTRTPLHIGAGASVGAIDQPIQRERHTGFPIIPGSSIKGVLRYTAANLATLDKVKINDIFGPELTGENSEKEARAGDVTFGEAQILAFPVRCAKSSFAYITCPLALTRFARATGAELKEFDHPEEQSCYAGKKVTLESNKVVLEEYTFQNQGQFPDDWETTLQALIEDPVWKECSGRLVLLTDGDFSHFTRTATEISNHVKIDARTGAASKGALFNLEAVPAETLFFSSIHVTGRQPNPDKAHYQTNSSQEMTDLAASHPVLQFGGNSTTGRGFCSITIR